MQKLFSTDEVRPRDRFSYQHDVACQRIVKHDSEPLSRQTFRASMQWSGVADSELLQFDNSGMDVWRTSEQASSETSDDVFFCFQVSGELAIEQNDRVAVLQDGDMALIDPALPYAGRFSSMSKLLVFKTSRRALGIRVGKCEALWSAMSGQLREKRGYWRRILPACRNTSIKYLPRA